MSGKIHEFIPGIRTFSGGTRTIVKIHRPWQPKLRFPEVREACELCVKQDDGEHHPGRGWKVFPNLYTPSPWHSLLIPDRCWPEDRLRALDGEDGLARALIYGLREPDRLEKPRFPLWLQAHIGYGAGQNFPHYHWHVYPPPDAPRSFVPPVLASLASNQMLWSHGPFTTAICGVRAGQALIYAHNGISATRLYEDDQFVTQLATEIHQVVTRFNQKFLYPDYQLQLAITNKHEWHVRYTPILNNWGASEFAAIEQGTAFILPWPHEETVKFLLTD